MKNRIPKVAMLSILSIAFFSSAFAQEKETVDSLPVLKVGHVGHDHQIALGVAALAGEKFRETCGAWLEELKPREIYVLHCEEGPLARLDLIKVHGGSGMPAAMERGQIDIGYGGVPAVAFFVDKGNDFKIVSALNTDGDMLVMRKGFGATGWEEFVEKVRTTEKPLSIGYKAPVAVAKLIFEKGLQAEGIEFGAPDLSASNMRIVMVNLHGQKNMIPSLASGAVDGFVTNEPAASRAVVTGCGEIVCDLADLPPRGKWEYHPCCCIAVRQETLEKHRKILLALLKTMLVATERIHSDKDRAAQIAADWTRTALEVEQSSVPNIHYMAKPDERWFKGMKTWVELMQETAAFTDRFANKAPQAVIHQLCDFSLIEEAEKNGD